MYFSIFWQLIMWCLIASNIMISRLDIWVEILITIIICIFNELFLGIIYNCLFDSLKYEWVLLQKINLPINFSPRYGMSYLFVRIYNWTAGWRMKIRSFKRCIVASVNWISTKLMGLKIIFYFFICIEVSQSLYIIWSI
jgi:hypothetical protein